MNPKYPIPEQLQTTQANPYRDIGRNDPCPCGSGQKYKRCHYNRHRAQRYAYFPKHLGD